MRIVTREESQHWCAERGFDVDFRQIDPRSWKAVRFLTERKQCIVAAFVRAMVAYRPFDGAIVYMIDWPLYSEDEMATVSRFRASIGEQRALIDAPGHIFDKNDLHDCVGLFNLSVMFRWDAYLYVPASQLLFFNSHDELQYVTMLSGFDRAQLEKDLEPYELTILK
jgi:hypothetical protein